MYQGTHCTKVAGNEIRYGEVDGARLADVEKIESELAASMQSLITSQQSQTYKD